MKTIFKGNPFSIVWNIIDRSTNHPFEFTGMKVEVGIYSDSFNVPLQSYNVNNGTITAEIEANTFPAGVFNLMCRYSTDHEQSYCTYRNAFQISSRPCHTSEIVEIESYASHIDPSSEDPDAPDYSKCQLIAEELFGEKLHLPELTAHRAIADEFGNRIIDTYVTRNGLTNHIKETYNLQFTENPPLIMEGYITPEMLSEETRQMLEATGQEVTNLPDGEDLTTVHGVLKLANKQHNPNTYSGLGRQYLRKNIVAGVNILTQSMMQWPNTIYIIQYDYDLRGEEITIPEGSILQYEGGSISNGHIVYQDTTIQGVEKLNDVRTEGISKNGVFDTDGEDITKKDGILKFANKEYDTEAFSGLGRVYLRKNVVDGKNVLTQEMVSHANTIYIIQYDYDLQDAEIIVPKDCVLDFQGGRLNNGRIVFNETLLEGVVCIDKTCVPSGSIANTEVLVDWFGAVGDSVTDNSSVFKNILKLASTTKISDVDYSSKTFVVKFNIGNYVVKNSIVDDSCDYSKICFQFKGAGMEGGTTILYKGNDDTFLFNNWGYFSYTTFDGIKFQGNNKNNCFLLKSEEPNVGTQSFNFTNCRWTCFYKTFVSEGSSMCSEVSFINCKFVWFEANSIIFTFNNQQSVNWRFFGTDIEQTYGTIFLLKQGTFISLFQSSIIPFGGIVIQIPDNANKSTFWYTNFPQAMMYSCRFELWNDSKLFVCKTASDSGAKFVNCMMGGGMIKRTEGVYQIELMPNMTTELNNCKLIFEGCSDFRNYRAFVGAHLGNINAGYLSFCDCLGFSVDTFIADSVFPNNGNNEWMPKLYVDRVYQPYNLAMAKGYKQSTIDYIVKHKSADKVVPNIEAGSTVSFATNDFKLNRWVGSITFNIMPTTDIKLVIRDTDSARFYGIYNIKAWSAFDVTIKIGKYITSENNLVISFTNTAQASCSIEGVIKVSEVFDNANKVPFDKVSLDPNGPVDSSFCVYKEALLSPVWWDGVHNTWRDAEGFRSLLIKAGTTEQLAYPNASDVGMMRYNTTIGKPVWWTGSKWVDATGAEV